MPFTTLKVIEGVFSKEQKAKLIEKITEAEIGVFGEGMEMSLGFMKPSQKIPFAHPSSFGMPGFGGCFGFADPHAKIGFAYVPNRTDFYLMDPRQNALRMAMYRSIGETNLFLLQEEGGAHI